MHKPKGASIFLIDELENILLLLRDQNRKPCFNIPYPNMWDVIGGHVEEGEDPKDCILREMKEELQTWSFNGRNLPLWRIIDFPDRIDYAFWDYLGSQSLNTLNKNLTEGQRVCSFALGEVLNMELAYGWQPYVVEFFEGRRRRRHIEDPTH